MERLEKVCLLKRLKATRMVLFETSLGFSRLKYVDFYSLTHDDYMEIWDLLYSICQVGPKKANITVNELI